MSVSKYLILTSKTLIVIVGPTAVGKTSFSIQLAKKLKCEIISADSRQFYKEISIGTAKPSNYELNQVKHHFIDSLSIHDNYSAGQFEEDALKCVTSLFQQYNRAILVGGSGMYVDAVCSGIDEIPSNSLVRAQLNKEFNEHGILPLQKELEQKDPTHFKSMDIQNPNRLIRALEVCRHTGNTYTSYRKNKPKKRPFSILKIGLHLDKEKLHENISNRVDTMLNQGLLREINKLEEYQNLNALNTVGYKELFKYKNNLCSLEAAITDIKRNTIKFAKRQMTWFKKDESVHWFNVDNLKSIQKFIEKKIN